MKLYPNLAGSLRFYFGLARTLVLIFGVFWIGMLSFGPLLQKAFSDQPKLMVSMGDVSIRSKSGPINVQTTAQPGSLTITGLHGPLQADLMSSDRRLASALRWTAFPAIIVVVVSSWLLCSALRAVCGNIAQGEVFTDPNLRLIRNIGVLLIVFSVAGFLVQLLASAIMDRYFAQHVSTSGLPPGLDGSLHFQLTLVSQFPVEPGLVAGLLVLLLSQAFRQGLALKAENDLTV
jgi:hypothetical protein